MNQSHMNINPNFAQFEDDDEEEGILSKTASFVSSLFYKVANSINPFKSKKNVQNPYDLNSSNDPSNFFNNVSNMNSNNNLYTSLYTNHNNYNNQNIQDQNFIKRSKNYLGTNNWEDLSNKEREDDFYLNVDYITVEEFCNISPHLKEEIYKDIKRPNYIPNEEIFQKAKKYVYDNLVQKYKLMKPKINDKIFGESVLLLAIQLTNKYNIEKHYDYLINNTKNIEYKLEINVPEIIKNYYTNKAKTLFHEDLVENSEKISNDINKELLNKFSNGLFNNKKDNDDINSNDPNENRLVCRTPKTKRNYITCLYENRYNYDYLCPNDKVQIKIFKECLLHKENELRNYARVIEVTNNMFKFTCNENQKLRDVIKQKEERIEDFAQQIILYKIKDNEYQQKINNYENEIKNLKNNPQNIIQNPQNMNENNNLINKNLNIPSQNSSINNNINFDNINSKSSIFTLKKSYEPQHEFSFSSNNINNIVSSEKTATFNNINNNNSLNFSKSNKNDSNSVLVLNNQSLNKNENKESEQKKPPIFFSFSQTEEKKEEDKNKSESNTNSDKNEKINNFNIFNSVNNETQPKFNFGFIENKKEEKSNKNPINDNNPINNNSKKNKNLSFGFISEEKNENEEEKKEEEIKKEINNEKKEEKKEEIKENNNLNDTPKEQKDNNKEDKKEESGDKMNISLPENKEEPKKEEKAEQIFLKKESLNNPNNPFLSTVNIKTNEEFSINFLKTEKDNNKNDISDRCSTRNTMDNTNTLIKIGDFSNLDNSNSNSFIFNANNISEPKCVSHANPFIIGQNNDIKENKNPFIVPNKTQEETSMNIINKNNNSSNNIFLSNNNNLNSITNFNDKISSNINDISNNNNSQQNNPFLFSNRSNSQNNNSNSNNNPFLSFNTNNNETQSLTRSQNPFMSQTNNGTNSIFHFNNNETKTNNNPFINANINTANNNYNNNAPNSNSQTNNPFLSFSNNNNNGSSNSNNLNSNNPFLKNDNLPSSNAQIFGSSNINNNNNSSSNNSNSLFSFKINAPEGNDKVNPFLSNKNGFDFGSSNKSNNAFAMGVNMKKPGGNNYISIFDDNKPRKIDGFFN